MTKKEFSFKKRNLSVDWKKIGLLMLCDYYSLLIILTCKYIVIV